MMPDPFEVLSFCDIVTPYLPGKGSHKIETFESNIY